MKYSILIVLTIIIVSCTPKFEVTTSKTASYADPKESIVYLGDNNIVSTFNSELTLNPFVEKDIKTKQIKRIALKLNSKQPKKFQFGEISSIKFINDVDSEIELKAIDFNSNPYITQNGMKINPNEIVETCEFNLTKEKLDQIINFNVSEIKINSVNKNLKILKTDISKSFLSNLKSFYEGYITK